MSDLIQQEELLQLKEVMEDEFEMLVSMYIEDSAKLIQEMEQYLNNNDMDALRVSAHTLKGSSSNMCVNSMTELARSIEEKAKNNDAQGVPEYLQQIKQIHPEVVRLLQNF